MSENDYNEIEWKYLKPDKSYLSYNGYKYHRISKIENKSKTIRYRCIGCLSCGLLVKEDKIFSHPSIKDKHKPPLCHQKNVNEIECIIAEEKIKHNAQKAVKLIQKLQSILN